MVQPPHLAGQLMYPGCASICGVTDSKNSDPANNARAPLADSEPRERAATATRKVGQDPSF